VLVRVQVILNKPSDPLPAAQHRYYTW
jgi:hypothetical protein